MIYMSILDRYNDYHKEYANIEDIIMLGYDYEDALMIMFLLVEEAKKLDMRCIDGKVMQIPMCLLRKQCYIKFERMERYSRALSSFLWKGGDLCSEILEC